MLPLLNNHPCINGKLSTDPCNWPRAEPLSLANMIENLNEAVNGDNEGGIGAIMEDN